MSSSPEESVNGYSTPPHQEGNSDTSDTSTSSTASGFTAVNSRASPPQTNTKVNGANRVNGIHRPIAPKDQRSMENPVAAAQPYEHDTIRVDTGRASPGDDVNSAGKRKRSITEGEGRERPAEQGEYSPPDKRRTPPQPQSNNWHSPPQGIARQPMQYPAPDSDPKEAHAWYDNRQQRESPNADARMAEALQRENQNIDARHHLGPISAPPMDHHIGGTPHNEITSTTETTAAGVQVDPKKRKRVFSNRTKTGCQTCRKRKKKCDEAKPECNNCKRGGFVCEGYNHKQTYPRPATLGKAAPIAIQSRDGYDTGGLMPRPARSDFHELAQSTPQSQPPPSNGSHARPIMVDQEHPRSSWGTPSWSETPSRAFVPERTSSTNEFPHGMPLPDMSRPQQSYEDRSAAANHHMGVTSHGQPVAQYVNADVDSLPHGLGRRNEELTSMFSNRSHSLQSTINTAQQALQHAQSASSMQPHHAPHHTPQKAQTEKEKMIAGEPYLPYTPQLMDEREACKAALWRFNKSQDPSNGVSREERARLFSNILIPAANDIRRAHHPVGRLGKDVVIEGPFHCQYGYNISIGENVVIEANCTIMDACRVTIGNNCIIGPNVSIYASTASTDWMQRNGSKGHQKGKPVHIGDNVFIGGNVVIKPGVEIGKNCVIGAGTVVNQKRVPPNTVFSAPKSDVRGGIYDKPPGGY